MQQPLSVSPRPPNRGGLASPAPAPARRYHELDWLRALIILALVPAHAMGFFTANAGSYYDTPYVSPLSLSTLMTMGTWGMALLFLVAGASAGQAVGRRTPRQFIRERAVRLMIPFFFASLTLIPLQDYLLIRAFPQVLGRLSVPPGWEAHLATNPLAFYGWFVVASCSFLLHFTPQYEYIFWSHLWFIPRLFVISVITLPLLRWLRAPEGAPLVTWLARQCERHRWAIYLLAVPLGVINAALGWQWQGWQVVGAPDTANVLAQFAFYTIVYLYGALLYLDERLRQAVRRDGGVAAVAVALTAFAITQIFGVGSQALAHDYSAGGLMGAALRTTAAWLCVVGLLGLCARYLAFTNRVGSYLTEASYPFYVLHLAVLYLVGLPLLTSGAPGLLGFFAMVILTFALTLAVYELLIRRIPPLRVLFGIKTGTGAPPLPAPA